MTYRDRLIDVKQVAEIFGIAVPTVWSWHRKKEGFPQKIEVSSQCTRWSLNEVTAYLTQLMSQRECGLKCG